MIETIQNLRVLRSELIPAQEFSGVFDHFEQLSNGSDSRIALLTETKDIKSMPSIDSFIEWDIHFSFLSDLTPPLSMKVASLPQ